MKNFGVEFFWEVIFAHFYQIDAHRLVLIQ